MGKYNLILISILLAIAVPIINTQMQGKENDWTFFIIALVSAFIINITVLYVVYKDLKELLFQRVYVFLILWNLIWFITYHMIAVDTHNPYGGFSLPYDRYGIRFYWAWLVPAMLTVLMYPFLRLMDGVIRRVRIKQPPDTKSMRKAVVFVFLVFNLIYLFANLNAELPVISYIGRVGHSTSLLFLFWIGFWNRKLGTLFYVTLLVVLTIAVFELLTGSRYGPMITALLLLLGYYFSASRATKWKLRLVGIVAVPFVIVFLGYLEQVRVLIGRGNLEDVSIERVQEVRKAVDKIDNSGKKYGSETSAFVAGVARNINWVDIAVISASGDRVRYRGSSNLDNELGNIFTLALFSSGSSASQISEARQDRYAQDLGTAPARRYGFSVNERTSVEWSILSDGYSRGGLPVYGLYLLLFLILINFIELAIKVLNHNGVEQKLLLSVFLFDILKSNSLPFYEIIRNIILNGSFYIAILLMLRLWTMLKNNK